MDFDMYIAEHQKIYSKIEKMIKDEARRLTKEMREIGSKNGWWGDFKVADVEYGLRKVLPEMIE